MPGLIWIRSNPRRNPVRQTPPSSFMKLIPNLSWLVVCVLINADPFIAASSTPTKMRPAELPADFIENRGQWGVATRFVARKGLLSVILENNAIDVQVGRGLGERVRLTFEAADTNATLSGEQKRH